MSLQETDVRLAWPVIGEKLREHAEPLTTAEEIYHLCRAGQAHLLMNDDCFVVLAEAKKQHSTETEILILAAVSLGGADLIARYLPEIEEIARRAGGRRLSFRTARQGFSRAIGGSWRVRATEYVTEL